MTKQPRCPPTSRDHSPELTTAVHVLLPESLSSRLLRTLLRFPSPFLALWLAASSPVLLKTSRCPSLFHTCAPKGTLTNHTLCRYLALRTHLYPLGPNHPPPLQIPISYLPTSISIDLVGTISNPTSLLLNNIRDDKKATEQLQKGTVPCDFSPQSQSQNSASPRPLNLEEMTAALRPFQPLTVKMLYLITVLCYKRCVLNISLLKL